MVAESDFLVVNYEYSANRQSLSDTSLDGILHAIQFDLAQRLSQTPSHEDFEAVCNGTEINLKPSPKNAVWIDCGNPKLKRPAREWSTIPVIVYATFRRCQRVTFSDPCYPRCKRTTWVARAVKLSHTTQ
jgi:hypothetical protein